ncbi:MAG TPA: DEAD/DEAH box helicase family protein [Pirellulales bacterium]|nr:DEAD/DEAH box helicase family protein [Pirellulales bacterium]
MPVDLLPTPRLDFSSGTLLLAPLPRVVLRKVFDPLSWVWDARVGAWRIDAIDYRTVRERLTARRLACDDTVPRWHAVRWPKVELHSPRTEQQQAVAAWQATRRGCVVMPTGTGKTEVALTIMREAAVATLVVAPVRDLMYQWHRRILAGLGYDAGVIGDNIHRVRPVSVTTYDSACIHMERLGDQFGLIVFDECHHLPGQARRDAARMSAAPARLGLTATLQRADGRHTDLIELIGPTVYEVPIAEARGKTLADYEVIRIPVHLLPDEQNHYDTLSSQVRRYMMERLKTEPTFRWEDLCAETGKTPAARRAMRAYFAKKAIEDRAEEKLRVLEDLFRLHAGSPTIVFAGSNAMARDVSRRFLIPCLLSHCGKRERLEVLSGLEAGTYPALVANQVLDEGVDLPACKVAVVIGGMASTKQAKQRLGRILRKSGNARATLYEIVCDDTSEAIRSRQRRKNDAYQGTRHRRL